jgi:hypothetical protein
VYSYLSSHTKQGLRGAKKWFVHYSVTNKLRFFFRADDKSNNVFIKFDNHT